MIRNQPALNDIRLIALTGYGQNDAQKNLDGRDLKPAS